MRSLLVLLGTICLCAASLPFCQEGNDTIGSWVSTAHYHNSSVLRSHVDNRFFFGGPGSAVNFSHIWVPDDCSYHRFTNDSLLKVLSHMQQRANSTEPIRLIVNGDSAVRGVICGITRIMEGSELFGPCENEICGSPTKGAASFFQLHQLFNLFFAGRLELTFVYIQTLSVKYTRWMIEGNIGKSPYAFLLSTGAWDFHAYNKAHPEYVAQEYCDNAQMEGWSQHRLNGEIEGMFAELGTLAKALKVRAIWRTNHHNAWFGTHCADDRLLPVVRQNHWEVWDNRRISDHVWAHQVDDGFHFDRHATHTVEQHRQERAEAHREGRPMPGMLEMQLTQSLLHMLFGRALQEMVQQGGSLS